MTGTWREEHLFNLGQAFKTLQFLDDRLAEYDRKVSVMFAALAETSGNPPPPPTSGYKKNNSKERGNSEIKANIFQFMGFDMTSIPGIGYATAAIIAAELGTNMDSFPNEKHFTSYIGLAPTLGIGKRLMRPHCIVTLKIAFQSLPGFHH